MTLEQMKARLEEKGMWFEMPTPSRRSWRVIGVVVPPWETTEGMYVRLVSTGPTPQEAYAEAMGETP